MRPLSTGEPAAELGVAVGTLRRWHRQGLLMPFSRTVGRHRRYWRDTVRATRGGSPRRSVGDTAGTTQTPCSSTGISATPATKIRTYRFVHHQANG
ncbi:MerR family DNA-binding transcriptional regulator [Paraburkholderia sp. BCC1884]|uniref:MerR family DNA-binding transcriptional regulator n=1 Tax=Paraburkholderia sp. BCC1884 TaxID=2562668 RepID=UPI0011844837